MTSERADFPAGRRVFRIGHDVVSGLYLTLLIAFAVRYMWSSVFRTWFFSSDEYVVAAEVIRFAQLDFRQHFVDMPGTPLMFLGSAVWSVFYFGQCALGRFPLQRGIGEFTFEHLPALFVLLRGLTLFFFCLSIVLLFWLTARLANRATACVAALILAMSPTYASMSSFVRVESLSMCCSLAACLCLLHAVDRPERSDQKPLRALQGFFDWIFLAGVLSGLAAATRLHSIVATLPVLALLLVLWPPVERHDEYPRWAKALAGLAFVALAGAGWLLIFTLRSEFDLRPHAYHLLGTAVVGAACALILVFLLHAARRTRGPLIRIVSPNLIRLLVGCGVGLLVGMPTVLRQYPFFLGSMEMYSTNYQDFERVGWPFWKHVQWYLAYYWNVAAPDRIVSVLLGFGAVCVLVRRDRRAVPFLVGAILFFVSKPLNVVPAPHHLIPWLPFVAILCGYPIWLLFDILARRVRHGQVWAWAAFLIGFPILVASMTPGPKAVAEVLPSIEERLANVQRATDWIKHHTEPQATIAVSYFCFNPDIFYVWTRSLEVPLPWSVFDSRTFIIWWGNASTLKGQTGYVCATPSDVALKAQVERRSPGDASDLLKDRRFDRIESFGTGPNEVSVFRFDYRN